MLLSAEGAWSGSEQGRGLGVQGEFCRCKGLYEGTKDLSGFSLGAADLKENCFQEESGFQTLCSRLNWTTSKNLRCLENDC